MLNYGTKQVGGVALVSLWNKYCLQKKVFEDLGPRINYHLSKKVFPRSIFPFKRYRKF